MLTTIPEYDDWIALWLVSSGGEAARHDVLPPVPIQFRFCFRLKMSPDAPDQRPNLRPDLTWYDYPGS